MRIENSEEEHRNQKNQNGKSNTLLMFVRFQTNLGLPRPLGKGAGVAGIIFPWSGPIKMALN